MKGTVMGLSLLSEHRTLALIVDDDEELLAEIRRVLALRGLPAA